MPDPATIQVSGRAIRIVNGARESTPLVLIKMNDPATYAVLLKWPNDVPVTLEFVARSGEAATSMLVNARGTVVDRSTAKFYPRAPGAEEEKVSLQLGQ